MRRVSGQGVVRHRGQRRLIVALALGLAGWTGVAAAMTFGPLRVTSALNRPFAASFMVTGISPSTGTSDIGMAPAARFDTLGIHRAAVIDRIQVTTERRSATSLEVHLATRSAVRDPFVDLLIQVSGAEGTSVHEYTALLDPAPANSPNTPASAATSEDTMPASAGRVLPPIPHDRATGTRSSRAASGPYRVRNGDTLWAIAAARTPSGADVAQTALAIYRANPEAFAGGPGQLQQGARLSIPEAATIRRVSSATASAQVAGDTDRPGARDDDETLAASGRLPPDRLKTGRATADDTNTSERAADAPASSPPAANGTAITAVDDGPFGTLVAPASAPWTTREPGTSPAEAKPAVAPGLAPAEQPRQRPALEPLTDNTTPSTAATNTPTPSDNAPPASPRDSGGGLFRPRNLLLLLIVLMLVLFYVRRRTKNDKAGVAPRVAGSRGRTKARRTGKAAVEPLPEDGAAPRGTDPTLPPESNAGWLAAVSGRSRKALGDHSAPATNPLPDAPIASAAERRAASTPGPAASTPTTRAEYEETGTPASLVSAAAGVPAAAPGGWVPDIGRRPDTDRDGGDTPRRNARNTSSPDVRPVDAASPPEPERTPAPAAASPRETEALSSPASDARPNATPDDTPLDFEAVTFTEARRQHDPGAEADDGLAFDDDETAPTAPLTTDSGSRPDHAGNDKPMTSEKPGDEPLEIVSVAPASPTPPLRPLPSETSAAKPSSAPRAPGEIQYDLEMIDPGEFDLYDPAPTAKETAEDAAADSLQIRLDLARMYIDMDDAEAARELAEDVRSRGNDAQRAAAERLLAELDHAR